MPSARTVVLCSLFALSMSAGLARAEQATPSPSVPAEQWQWEVPTLAVGSPAPALSASAWIGGESVSRFAPGTVYVVEFFASYDSGSRENIPHLTKLQSEFAGKGLVVIGLAGREDREADVPAMAQRLGDRLGYRIGIDTTGKTDKSFMAAAQRFSYPCSFVVDREGKIAWIGHLRAGLRSVVSKVLDGTFDPQVQAQHDREFAEQERKFTEAKMARDYTAAEGAIIAAMVMRPEVVPAAQLARFEMLLTEKKDYSTAYALAYQLIHGELKDEDRMLRKLAGMIAERPGVEQRDWTLALTACNRAVEITGGRDGWSVGALAEIQFLSGNVNEAITTQEKALRLAQGDVQLLPRITDALSKYRAVAAKRPVQTDTSVSGVPTE